MSDFDDRHLDFVTRHYKEGMFDTQKAIERFNSAHPKPQKVYRVNWMRISSVASAVAMLVGLFFYLKGPKDPWTELMAYSASETFVLPDSTSVTLSRDRLFVTKDLTGMPVRWR